MVGFRELHRKFNVLPELVGGILTSLCCVIQTRRQSPGEVKGVICCGVGG